MGNFVNYRKQDPEWVRDKKLSVRLNFREIRYIKDIASVTGEAASTFICLHLKDEVTSLKRDGTILTDISELIKKGRGDVIKNRNYSIRLSRYEYECLEYLSNYWGLSKGEYVAYLIIYHRNEAIKRRDAKMKRERGRLWW